MPRLRLKFAVAVIVAVTVTRLLGNLPELHMLTRADSLMWGCLFAIKRDEILAGLNKSNLLKVLPFVTLLGCLAIKKILPGLELHHPNVIRAFLGSFGLVTNISICCVILVSIYAEGSLWFRFLNTPVMDYLGKLSYSIYIWQQLFFSHSLHPLSSFPLNMLVIFLVANISYYFVELPFLKLKGRTAAAPVAA
jgi:peptidoglycan/LPS O-acetylase OafA/YrhL